MGASTRAGSSAGKNHNGSNGGHVRGVGGLFPSPGKGRGAVSGVNDPSWVREGASRKIPKVQGLEGF